jgi:hypothetical protein
MKNAQNPLQMGDRVCVSLGRRYPGIPELEATVVAIVTRGELHSYTVEFANGRRAEFGRVMLRRVEPIEPKLPLAG